MNGRAAPLKAIALCGAFLVVSIGEARPGFTAPFGLRAPRVKLTANKVALGLVFATAGGALAVSAATSLPYQALLFGGLATEAVAAAGLKVFYAHKYRENFKLVPRRDLVGRALRKDDFVFTPEPGQKVPWLLQPAGPTAGEIVVGKARTLGDVARALNRN